MKCNNCKKEAVEGFTLCIKCKEVYRRSSKKYYQENKDFILRKMKLKREEKRLKK